MSILIQKPGILTTVQDLGRRGCRRFGVNPGGVMDVTAARLVNILLGNDDNSALLEMHFPAPQILFEADAVIALGGGEFDARIDGRSIENWRPHFAAKGSTLTFAGKVSGNRSYLAVGGGFAVEHWLGSSSTNLSAKLGGFEGRKLGTGDRIKLISKASKKATNRNIRVSNSLLPFYRPFPTVRVIRGAEFELPSESGRELLFDHDFTVSGNSNRMGFRLNGESLTLDDPFEMVSSAASFGTIQLLPDGQLIVLMADHQTAGGYPRVAHVITHDLPLIAQLGANDKVAFHAVHIKDAEDLAIQFEKELNFLRIACRFQTK